MSRPRNEHRPAGEPAAAVRNRPVIGFASAPIVGLKSYRARISEAARRTSSGCPVHPVAGHPAPTLRAALKPA